MRKTTFGMLTITALLLTFIATPAQATGTQVSCTTGNFTVTDNVVTDGTLCSGVAVIPSGVTSISNYAFQNAFSLTSVTIPNSVTSIGTDAFSRAGLTSISIPESVLEIGAYAFDATKLTSITVSPSNPNYSSRDGVLFDKLQTRLIQYPTGNIQAAYSIPIGVTSIVEYAFNEATFLSSINIPESVLTIGVSAFDGASALASVNFSADSLLETIGSRAFKRNTSLTSITLPASILIIGAMAFNGSNALTAVYFLGNAPEVEAAAFEDIGAAPKAHVTASATGFSASGENWKGLTVVITHPTSRPVSTTVSTTNYFVVEGFGRGKSTLNKHMRKFIQVELQDMASVKSIVCTGTVRGKTWSPKKEALALARAKAGCDYANILSPNTPIELRKRLISKLKGNPQTVRIRAFS